MKALLLMALLANSNAYAKNTDATNTKIKAEQYTMTVTEKGYEPSKLTVKAGVPVKLLIKRTTNATCAREIVVPAQNLKVDLPLNKEVEVSLAPLAKGEIKFGCAMDLMIAGVVLAQ